MTQPVYQAPVQTGMQFYAQPQQQFQANQQQFAIPASQYQQYQQFLQFQQQQALKHWLTKCSISSYQSSVKTFFLKSKMHK